MKQLSAHDLKRILNSQLVFEPQKYRASEQKKEYLNDLLNYVIIKQRVNVNMMCLNELHDLLRELQFDMSIQQVHELYLYCTFELKDHRSKLSVKDKLMSLVNQQRRKISVELLIDWLYNNMEQIRIRTKVHPATSVHRNRSVNQNPEEKLNKTITNPLPKTKLPRISPHENDKLKNELQPLIELFDEMEKLRHDSGLIPMKMDEDEDDLVDLPFMHIPYDPELHDLNVNIAKLRIKAEQQLKRIIQISRQDPSVRRKLQAGIQKFQKSRIEKNEKIGRTGAINAQRRLAQQRQKEINKHKNLHLDFDQDLVRAARVYSLLNMPDPKNKPVF